MGLFSTKKRSLEGRLAFITGGGRGIGQATALALVDKGVRVAVSDIDGIAAEETAELAKRRGGDARAYCLDVTDAHSFDQTVERVEGEFGPIDILINNAGIMTVGSFLEHSKAQDESQIEINLNGVVHGMRAVLPRMKGRGRGHVVNVSSLAGRVPAPHAAVYTATKFGVIGLTEAVRGELRGSGIDFTYVLPAFVNTELIAGTGRPRWLPPVEPDQVARGVVFGLQHNVLDVFVPKGTRATILLHALLPRSIYDWVGRVANLDRMFAQVDETKRADYLERTQPTERPGPAPSNGASRGLHSQAAPRD